MTQTMDRLVVPNVPALRLPESPARHFNNFSFLPINPEYKTELDVRVAELMVCVAYEFGANGKSLVLAHEEWDGLPTIGKREETTIAVFDRHINVRVMSGDDIGRYYDVGFIEDVLERPEPVSLKNALARFFDAASQYSAEVTVRQMMNPPRDIHRLGAPRIVSPRDLRGLTITKGVPTEQSFHNDGIDEIFVSDSPDPTLLSEREVPVLSTLGRPIRMLKEGQPEDGHNIPASEVHHAEPGQAAVWDAQTSTHSGPEQKDTGRPFTRFRYENREAERGGVLR